MEKIKNILYQPFHERNSFCNIKLVAVKGNKKFKKSSR